MRVVVVALWLLLLRLVRCVDAGVLACVLSILLVLVCCRSSSRSITACCRVRLLRVVTDVVVLHVQAPESEVGVLPRFRVVHLGVDCYLLWLLC